MRTLVVMRVEDLGCTIDGRTLLEAGCPSRSTPVRPLALLGPSGAAQSLVLRCLLGLAPAQATVSRTLFWGDRPLPLADRAGSRGCAAAGSRWCHGQRPRASTRCAPSTINCARFCAIHDTDSRPQRTTRAEVGLSQRVRRPATPARAERGTSAASGPARARACRPAVLLADEPMASLDCVSQAALSSCWCTRCAAEQIALVLVSPQPGAGGPLLLAGDRAGPRASVAGATAGGAAVRAARADDGGDGGGGAPSH